MTNELKHQLFSLAREVYEEERHVERTIKKMLGKIEGDVKLRQSILEEAIQVAVAAVVANVVQAQRRAVVDTMRLPTSATAQRAYARVSVYDYPIAGATTLGEATKKQLLDAIAPRKKAVETERIEIAWLEAIAEDLPTQGAKVKHTYAEADLIQMRKRIERKLGGGLAAAS